MPPRRLAIKKTFLADYAKLDKTVRKSVDDAIDKFEGSAHAGLHLEKLRNAHDPNVRTIRITHFWRGVVVAPEAGDGVYCLVAVLPHDHAIRYATSRKFTVNQALGVLEERDAEALEKFGPALEKITSTDETRLFARVSDADLVRLGIDSEVLPLVRLLTTDGHLAALEPLLPEPQYLALLALASGMSPEKAWDEVCQLLPAGAAPDDEVDSSDLVTAMERTPGEVRFVSGPEELARILHHPFAAWRLFLHPAQRKLAYRDSYTGSVQVTGGAGTGKTVTALHRARWLAERSDRVLVTTFTKTLAAALGHQLDLLVDESALRERIEVTNVDKLANEVVRDSVGHHLRIIGDAERDALWNQAATDTGTDFSASFLQREWEQVILAQDLRDKASYLKCVRHGQRIKFTTAQKEQAWKTVTRFLGLLQECGGFTYKQINDMAAQLLDREPAKRYRHIIVDEAQDLHPAQWRVLRAAVEPGPDDLFIVGDTHQRIYNNRVSYKRLGIKISGRSYRLKQSYRTTAEILTWAVPVLGVDPFNGMDDAEDSLAGYRSSLHGRSPIVRAFPDRDAEHKALAEQIRGWIHDDKVEPHSIGIAARTRAQAEAAREMLKTADIKATALTATRVAPDCVRVGTMHSMKGLEFRCVAVIGVNEVTVPLPNAITSESEDPVTHRQDLQRERCVLFVACTRARDTLYVSYDGVPSPFLPA